MPPLFQAILGIILIVIALGLGGGALVMYHDASATVASLQRTEGTVIERIRQTRGTGTGSHACRVRYSVNGQVCEAKIGLNEPPTHIVDGPVQLLYDPRIPSQPWDAADGSQFLYLGAKIAGGFALFMSFIGGSAWFTARRTMKLRALQQQED